MIRFSFSSFYMSVIFANLMILFLYIAFHNQKLMLKLGLPILSGAVFVTILRMVIPFEFLFLSHNIYFPEAISKIITNFIHPHLFGRFSLWFCIKVIWIIGIAFFTIRYLKTEHDFKVKVEHYSERLSEFTPAYQVLKQIQQEFPKTQYIELRTYPFVQTPVIYGLRKPYILLPEELTLNDKQLYYVLRHEISHYLHNDAFIKFGVKFLCIIYWWNPLCKFLQEKADTILEMRIDQSIAKNSKQKVEYLECLLFVADQLVSSSDNIKSSRVISLCDKSSLTLKHRFQMLLNDEVKPFYNFKKYILLILLTILFLLSFIFIFEAKYIIPEDANDSITIETNEIYFIERKDGKYDMYLNGEHIGIENSLEYYPDDIPVYREEVKGYEKD